MSKKILIVGAGFAGATLAERFASQLNYEVEVIDERNHIAGNAYDLKSSNGTLYHKYGPHYFRTNSIEILEYLSKFTEWIAADYTIKIFRDNKLYSFPVNLDTFQEIMGEKRTEQNFIDYLNIVKSKKEINNFEDFCIANVGEELYRLFYRDYTIKQWSKHPKDLPASIAARIPIRTHSNSKYFDDKYQCIPKLGYTNLIENMLDHPNIKVKLNKEFDLFFALKNYDFIYYSGAIDRFFNYQLGPLPYRSLRFELEEHNQDYFQSHVQINYPELKIPYTRIVEVKHITSQVSKNTNIVKEYSQDFVAGKSIPYYPINNLEGNKLYQDYIDLAKKSYQKIEFIGRLGKFKYYNMDQIVANSTCIFKNFVKNNYNKKCQT